MKQGISIREFARRENVSDTLVRKALKLNRLAAFEDGSLNPLLVGSNWREGNAKSANPANPNANPVVRTSGKGSHSATPLPIDGETLDTHKARIETFLSKTDAVMGERRQENIESSTF